MTSNSKIVNSMNRRRILQAGALVAGVSALPFVSVVQAKDAKESALIYLSPFKSNGALSKCQAEIWFVQDDAGMYVVTAQDAWRAQAIQQGLTKTQIWVGDLGNWRSADGKYQQLPAFHASGDRVEDAAEHARLLAIFGKKYSGGWSTWGPRFKNGLADGSRVMLRYRKV